MTGAMVEEQVQLEMPTNVVPDTAKASVKVIGEPITNRRLLHRTFLYLYLHVHVFTCNSSIVVAVCMSSLLVHVAFTKIG